MQHHFSVQDLNAQRSLLQEIQTFQGEQLRKLGIAYKACAAAGLTDETLVTPIIYNQLPENTKSNVSHTNICLLIDQIDDPEQPQTITKQVPVTEKIRGTYLPVAPFTESDAIVVETMAQGLTETRRTGLLPGLSEALDRIISIQQSPTRPINYDVER